MKNLMFLAFLFFGLANVAVAQSSCPPGCCTQSCCQKVCKAAEKTGNTENQALTNFELADKIKRQLGLQNPTNDRLYAKYRWLKGMEKRLQASNVFILISVLGIVIAVLIVGLIMMMIQRNRALRLLKQHRATAE